MVTTNFRGDVQGIYNDAGELLANYKYYDAWGSYVVAKDAQGNDFYDPTHIASLNSIKYRGYYQDSDTGYYYLQSRYYDAYAGRFINADGYTTTDQGILGNNMFLYCLNNPVMYVDPTGTVCKWVSNGGIGPCNCIECRPSATSAGAGNISPWGKPNSYNSFSNGKGEKIERWFDKNGRANKDRHWGDHGNSKHHPNPHEHEWDWSKPKNPKPKEPTPFEPDTDRFLEIAFGVGLVVVLDYLKFLELKGEIMRGVSFIVPNKYSNFLWEILKFSNINKYTWKIAEEEILFFNDTKGKADSGFFNKKIMSSVELEDKIKNNEYYLYFTNIQAFPIGCEIENIKFYEDFLRSNCVIVVIFADGRYADVYSKDDEFTKKVYDMAVDSGWEEVKIITDENDDRTRF